MSYYGASSGSSGRQPDYPSAMYALGGKSQAELQQLIEDDNKFEDLIRSLPQVKQLYSEKEMLLASNKSLAEYNLSLEPQMNSSRVSLQTAHRDAVVAVEKVKRVKAEVAEKAGGGNGDPETMLAILQAAHSKADEESERIAEDFMSNSSENVDTFLEKFIEKRKIAHLRRVKIDKMKEILENHRRGNSSNPAQPYSVPTGGPVPYPNPLSPSRRAPMPPGYTAPPPAATYVPPSNNWGSPAPAQTAYPPPQAAAPAGLPYPLQPQGMPTYPY